jgi:hypothetical protein
MLEVYHEIRGNLDLPGPPHFSVDQGFFAPAVGSLRGDGYELLGLDRQQREQGDAGGNFKTPVEWPVLFTCHPNPEKLPYAPQTATRHV